MRFDALRRRSMTIEIRYLDEKASFGNLWILFESGTRFSKLPNSSQLLTIRSARNRHLTFFFFEKLIKYIFNSNILE